MEMDFTEIFCSYYGNIFFHWNFLFILWEYLLVNRVSEPLVRSKMAITLEPKLCLPKFSRGIERKNEGYQGTNVTLIFMRLPDLFLIPYFEQICTNFQNEADCLSVKSMADRDSKR